MRKRILVAAQQVELRARIARVLCLAGYAVELAESRKRARELAAGGDIEAAIVVHSADLVGLGRELCGKIPRTIILGHGTDDIVRMGDLLRGAHAGEALDEQKLLDRLAELTTSQNGAGDEAAPPSKILKIDGCKLDLAAHSFVDGDGREVRLTRAETRLLAALIDSPRRVLSRDQLCHAVAGRSSERYDRNVDMLVARLRRKIEPDPKSPAFILTVPGVGYKFAAQPQSARDSRSLPAIGLEQSHRSELEQAIASQFPELEKRQLTVLSCGLVGSTELAVNLDLEDLAGIIQRFQEICITVTRR